VWTAETVLVCALTVLHRSVESFPPIEFVARPTPNFPTANPAAVTIAIRSARTFRDAAVLMSKS